MRIPTLLVGGMMAYAPLTANGGTFLVNKTTDDESPHTLRWAILQNNAHPGGHRIQIVPTGDLGSRDSQRMHRNHAAARARQPHSATGCCWRSEPLTARLLGAIGPKATSLSAAFGQFGS